MTQNLTLTVEKDWLNRLCEAAHGYAEDAGDDELVGWIAELDARAQAAPEPMNFTLGLGYTDDRLRLVNPSGNRVGEGVCPQSYDERKTLEEIVSWMETNTFKVNYAEGASDDFAAYIGEAYWPDSRIRNSGAKLRASQALVLAALLARLARTNEGAMVPTVKPHLAYRAI